MNPCFVVAVLLFSGLLSAQVPARKPTAAAIANANSSQELIAAQKQIVDLTKRVDALESRVSFFNYLLDAKQDRTDSLSLDVTSHEFQRIDTSVGPLLVSVTDVTPFLNGYKLLLELGNPSNASYSDVKITVDWGTNYDWSKYSEDSLKTWRQSVRHKETPLTQRLVPGTWNRVELLLTPASSDELGYVRISLKTPQVYLSSQP